VNSVAPRGPERAAKGFAISAGWSAETVPIHPASAVLKQRLARRGVQRKLMAREEAEGRQEEVKSWERSQGALLEGETIY
jgi:hypothetical protein